MTIPVEIIAALLVGILGFIGWLLHVVWNLTKDLATAKADSQAAKEAVKVALTKKEQ